MNAKAVYLALCVVGTVLPCAQLLPFLRAHGPDPRALFAQLFSTPAGGFFGMDVIVSSVVLWVLVLVEGRRAGMNNLWAPIAANLAVGVSLGLPLFLYLRERRLETRGSRLAPDADHGELRIGIGDRRRRAGGPRGQ